MKERFKEVRLRPSSMLLVERANEIIDQYETDGIQLTLRQLYYQFVSRNWLANDDKNYKALGGVISEARLGGLVDWRALDDLGRVPTSPYFYESKADFVDSLRRSAAAYSLNRWEGQDNYVELHVEKQALSSVLGPIADKWGVVFSMNRGYSSQTAMYDASKRFIAAQRGGKKCVLLYAGDHDPSGEDMNRDIDDRLALMGASVAVEKYALTRAQITQYRCPPNPAKLTDSRAKRYIARHGSRSWEIDALDPKVLRAITEKQIERFVNKVAMRAHLAREAKERAEIQGVIDTMVSA